MVGTLLVVSGTLSVNLTAPCQLTLENGGHFVDLELHFCTFSGQISHKLAGNYILCCSVNFSDFWKIFVIFNNYFYFQTNIKNHNFALFSKSILVIPTKLGRYIACGKGHFVCEFDCRRPWPWKIVVMFKVWIYIFAPFLDK